jgi:hypothetical protein
MVEPELGAHRNGSAPPASTTGATRPTAPTPAPTSPEIRSEAGAGTSSKLGWAREHAVQAALVVTVLAGGVVRRLRRGRGRGSRRP